MQNILIAGGKAVDCGLVEALGAKVVGHWTKLPAANSLPKEVDRVVVISDDIGLELAKHVLSAAQKDGVSVLHTKGNLQDFAKALQTPLTEPKDECYNDVVVPLFNYRHKEKNKMASKIDGRTTGKNTQRAQMKITYLRELLAQDPKMNPTTVYDLIVAKFGQGLTPSKINEVRAKEFGVKFGPRGKPLDGAAVTATSVQSPKVYASKPRVVNADAMDRLSVLLRNVREEMGNAHVRGLSINADQETATVTYETERTIRLH